MLRLARASHRRPFFTADRKLDGLRSVQGYAPHGAGAARRRYPGRLSHLDGNHRAREGRQAQGARGHGTSAHGRAARCPDHGRGGISAAGRRQLVGALGAPRHERAHRGAPGCGVPRGAGGAGHAQARQRLWPRRDRARARGDGALPQIRIGALQVDRRTGRHQAGVSALHGNARAERRVRLANAMADEGIDILVVAGNPWRSDYLRFAADITPVEGHAFAFIDRDGPARIIVEHPAEAARLRFEQAELDVRWSLSAIEETKTAIRELGERRIALAPRAAVPYRLAMGPLAASIAPATALLDRLMLRKSPAEIEAFRRAAALAAQGYAVFRDAARAGRPERSEERRVGKEC